MARDGAQSPLQVGACPGYKCALMASKQQLKSQLDSLRSENQRLEELVDDLRQENPERMRMAETEGAYDDTMKQLEALQQENSALRERLAREQTADKEEEIASLSRQLREVIQEAEVSERRAQTAETENERMAEIVERMEERANTAEMEVKRLREEQSHAELERLRAMAAQQAKWEAREQRLEAELAQLVATERRVQEMSDRTVRRDCVLFGGIAKPRSWPIHPSCSHPRMTCLGGSLNTNSFSPGKDHCTVMKGSLHHPWFTTRRLVYGENWSSSHRRQLEFRSQRSRCLVYEENWSSSHRRQLESFTHLCHCCSKFGWYWSV